MSDAFKTCTRCEEEKDLDQFKLRAGSDHVRESWCRRCKAEYLTEWRQNNRERQLAWQREYDERHREQRRKTNRMWKLRTKYDLDEDDMLAFIDQQDGLCAICRQQPVSLEIVTREDGQRTVVDHDHLTNRVRGLLCIACNLLLGYANDDVAILGRAIEYLKKAMR